MRKLKLQMNLSLDGYVAGPSGEMDWLVWGWDDELKEYVSDLTDSVDTIIMGRKMAAGFVSHWENTVSNPGDPSHSFGKKMMDTPKVVFSKTVRESPWKNTRMANGDLAMEIDLLKNQPGKGIIAYGGAGFVSSLITGGLIDELYLFINPVAIGRGLPIFSSRTDLKLVRTKAFDCGIALHLYEPVSKRAEG
ncbi:MAG TPA: dihydrofolate reductase family protein [Chitinophagaceae bacterium]|nr:dihydrofolate reductase family protein [Chitinophagaceae bacterium]